VLTQFIWHHPRYVEWKPGKKSRLPAGMKNQWNCTALLASVNLVCRSLIDQQGYLEYGSIQLGSLKVHKSNLNSLISSCPASMVLRWGRGYGYFHSKIGLKFLIYLCHIITLIMFLLLLLKIFMKHIINIFIYRSEYISCHHRLCCLLGNTVSCIWSR
jgi:hypothetical protein